MRWALPALILVLSVAGYVLTTSTVRRDRAQRRAPPPASYLPATYLTGTVLRRGVDVSSWPALAALLRDPAIFAGTASKLGSLGRRAGFFVAATGHFGRGPGSRGALVL